MTLVPISASCGLLGKNTVHIILFTIGQPIHWNYKEDRLTEVLKDHENPEFIAPSHNPFYRIETGKQTCYGDQAFAVLKSLTEAKGESMLSGAKKKSFPSPIYLDFKKKLPPTVANLFH